MLPRWMEMGWLKVMGWHKHHLLLSIQINKIIVINRGKRRGSNKGKRKRKRKSNSNN